MVTSYMTGLRRRGTQLLFSVKPVCCCVYLNSWE